MVKTAASHAAIMGSTPVRVTKKEISTLWALISFFLLVPRTVSNTAQCAKGALRWVRKFAPSFPVGSSQDGANSRIKSPRLDDSGI